MVKYRPLTISTAGDWQYVASFAHKVEGNHLILQGTLLLGLSDLINHMHRLGEISTLSPDHRKVINVKPHYGNLQMYEVDELERIRRSYL